MDLVAFLRERFVESRAIARAAALDGDRWAAEAEAKLRIVDLYEGSKSEAEDVISRRPHGATVMAATGVVGGLRLALQELALAYSDHPDYDEGWRP